MLSMDKKACLKDDLKILMDMYPELYLDTEVDAIDECSSAPINGSLYFEVSLPNDLVVSFNDQQVTLTQLTEDNILFSIKPCEYPNLQKSIEIEIKSKWMSHKDTCKITEAMHTEFDELTNPNSTAYDPFTPILMLLFTFLSEDTARLLFGDYKICCESKEDFTKYLNLHSDVEDKKLKRLNFNCVICMETKKGDCMIKLPCGHLLCIACTKSYFKKMIEAGNINQVRCPECKREKLDLGSYKDYAKMKRDLFTPAIPFQFFHNILNEKLCKRYKDLFHAQASMKLSTHCTYACVTCPRCETWCVKDDLNDDLIQCNKCAFAFCFNCLHSWHGYNNKCGRKIKIALQIIEEYMDSSTSDERRMSLETKYGKNILEVEVSEYIADKMLDMAVAEEGSDLQRCPHCRLVVQRSEGCNKMKCAVCETLFCYICGSLLYRDDPYEHFREPYSPCYGRLFEGMPGLDS